MEGSYHSESNLNGDKLANIRIGMSLALFARSSCLSVFSMRMFTELRTGYGDGCRRLFYLKATSGVLHRLQRKRQLVVVSNTHPACTNHL